MRRLFGIVLAVLLASGAQAGEAPVKFEDALFAKFKHERCMNCHQFNSRRSIGRAFHTHRNRYLCESCHATSLTGLLGGEWIAPEGDRMDYTGMSAGETCRLVKRNMGWGDSDALLARHLLTDARVRWALESGQRPDGKRPTVPGGYEAWVRDVQAWMAGGMLCE